MADLPLSLNEREFLLKALKEGMRVDGRPVRAMRPMQLQFHDLGSAECQLGRTRFVIIPFFPS
jgi:exosome complex component RRP45